MIHQQFFLISWLNRFISAPLERVVFKALAKDPADRFQSAREFVRALDTTGLAGHVVGQLRELARGPRSDRLESRDDIGMSGDISSDDQPTASALPYVRKFEAGTTWWHLSMCLVSTEILLTS